MAQQTGGDNLSGGTTVDRGPGGGTLDYNTRLQCFSLIVDYDTGLISDLKIEQSILF